MTRAVSTNASLGFHVAVAPARSLVQRYHARGLSRPAAARPTISLSISKMERWLRPEAARRGAADDLAFDLENEKRPEDAINGLTEHLVLWEGSDEAGGGHQATGA
jgi:hypothetical protein